jgi:hypothetical protein
MGMLWVVAIGLIAGCSSADTTAGTSSANTGTGSGGSVSASSGSNGTDPSGTDSATSAPSLTQPGGASNSTPDGTALTIPITDNTDPTGTTGPTEVTQPSGTNDTTTQSTAPVDTFVDVPPSGPCAFTAPVPMGEVTWVQDGQLRALADGATPTCLLDGVDGGSPQAWSSDAGRVLLDPSTSATASGRRSTGFDHTMAAVVLSAPKGTATIAVDPVTHRLIRHGSDGAESDISFLAKTDEAIYHPGGTRIIAVGTDAAGNYGIWLSSNLGKEPKQVLSVADPSTPVTDLAFSADATQLYFIHGFVHRLTMAVLQLDEVGQADRGEANLVVSTLEQGTAAWSVGPCDSTGTVLMSSPILSQPADLRTMTGSPFVGSDVTLQPVGWLSGYRVVLAVRPSGCDGPADLWIWSTVDGFRHVAHGALASAVRLPRAAFRDLPDVIDQAAPG